MIIKKYKTIDSTNIKAKRLAEKGANPWTVVLAESQTTGYGRKKTDWCSPKGGLYFSVILPKSNIEDLQTLMILAAFIVAKVVKDNFPLEPFIKLPNDVILISRVPPQRGEDRLTSLGGKSQESIVKKICGILVENIVGKEVKLSVMGIGLNTNIEKFPKELKGRTTSLEIELGREVDNVKILEEIIRGLREQLRTISE